MIMKYISIVSFSSLILAMFFLITLYDNVNSGTKESGEIMLFDFAALKNMDDWLIVNDGIMGGLSKSQFILTDSNTAIFSGNVTLENNGGFASTRTKPVQFQLDGYKGILIRVKGDGKKYQFRVRADDRFDGVSYRHYFETKLNQWQTISLPFNEFVPVFRGRILRDVEPISPKDIQQLGILISDKQTGEFRFEIQWIKSYQ
jgi:NADH dehydrogenase [ubiquinone] 1 alpha subcomplex assembly factor 1